MLSLFPFLTRTDGCTVADRVRPNARVTHGLQESKRMLPLTTFFGRTDCSVLADGVRYRPGLALLQELQR